MITFKEPRPHELWALKEPTARAVNGTVELTLIVTAGETPQRSVEMLMHLELEDAQHLLRQLRPAVEMAEAQSLHR
jgi:hypothetical protein